MIWREEGRLISEGSLFEQSPFNILVVSASWFLKNKGGDADGAEGISAGSRSAGGEDRSRKRLRWSRLIDHLCDIITSTSFRKAI